MRETTVERAIALLQSRLDEIANERQSLEQALKGLDGGVRPRRNRASAASTPTRTRAPRTATRKQQTPPRKRRKRAAAGQRADELAAAIKKHPGAPVSKLASEIGIAPQQIYPIAKRLQRAGRIAKEDRGFALTKS